MLAYPDQDTVTEVASCTLAVTGGSWAYANEHRVAIDSHWQKAIRANPKYFNGTIHLVEALAIEGRTLAARLLATDFKNYLYWRHQGFPPAGVRDGFGSALIRACDGAYILGCQRAGNVNAGLASLPGGFIDNRDVLASGEIDIGASIVREVAEETGLGEADLQPEAGFIVTQQGPHVSLAKRFRSASDADALKARIRRHLDADPNSELADVTIVRAASDLERLSMPKFARLVLHEVTKSRGGA